MEKIFLKKGVCDCKIVVPENASIVEKTSADELCTYIGKALSVKLPVVSEKDAEGKCIYVGNTAFAKAKNVVGNDCENWKIAMVDGSVIINGGNDKVERGIIYGAYHFIEDILGVRWWNMFEEDVLELSELSLDDNFYIEGTPCFKYRKPFMHSCCGTEGFLHMARTRMNAISPLDDNIEGEVYDETVRKYGGARWMGRPHHAHTLGKYFPRDEYFDENPDWWAWNKREGKRIRTGSYCFSNEEFFNALLEKVLAYIKEDVELAEREGVELPVCYAVSLDDINKDFFCQCPECEKVLEESGDTGYLLKFVNRIAREVAKVYPWAKILTSAYANCIEPAKDGTMPEPNMVIYLADLFNDIARGIHAPTNKDYLRLVTTWADICKKSGAELYSYDYLYSSRTNYPLPLFYRHADTIPTMRDVGVMGVFIESQHSISDCWDINKYVLTHLLENPDLDADALIEDFTTRYYGKGAPYVKKYFEILKEVLDKNMMTVLCCGEDSRFNYIDSTTAIKASEYLFKASELACGEAPFAERINWLRKPLDAVILFKFFELKKQAAERNENFCFEIGEVKKRLIKIIREHMEVPIGAPSKAGLESEIEYFEEISEEEIIFDIPKEFADISEDDICQVTLLNMPKYSQKRIRGVYGYSPVADSDSKLPEVMKLSYDNAKGVHLQFAWVPSNSYDEIKVPLLFRFQSEGEDIVKKEIFKDDIIQGGYHIYRIGSLAGMKTALNTRLALPGGAGSINISGLSATFPMENCDIYLSMKFTGEIYGGNEKDENAMFIERMIVVRK